MVEKFGELELGILKKYWGNQTSRLRNSHGARGRGEREEELEGEKELLE